MSPQLRVIPLVPYLVIIGLICVVVIWLHHDDLKQAAHNREDCLMQTNHANSINKIIDEISVFILTQEKGTLAERRARISQYQSYKAIVPDCANY